MTQQTLFDYEQTEQETSDAIDNTEKNNSNSDFDDAQRETTDDPSDPGNSSRTDGKDPGSLCPCYDEELHNCRNQRGKQFIDEYNISTIKCGHAIDYLNENVATTITESTSESYASKLRIYIEYLHEKGVTVCDAELRDIDQFFKSLAKKDYAESSINAYRAAIINLQKHASLYRDANPTARWDLIREELKPSDYQTPEPVNRSPLTKEELKSLYDAIDDIRDKVLVQVGVEVGARKTDLCSIQISDVNFEEQKVKLSNTKENRTYQLPLTSELRLLLRRWIDIYRSTYPGAEEHDYLFPSKNKGKLNEGGVYRIIREAAEEAGIQSVEGKLVMTERQKETLGTEKDSRDRWKVKPHTLRHTFCYLLEEAGLPTEARGAALDQNSIEVTKEYYGSNDDDYMNLIKELFTGIDL